MSDFHAVDFLQLILYYTHVIPRRGFLIEELDTYTKPMKFTEYVKDTRAEMAHVNWPSREQTTRFTVMVIVISVLVAALLGISDFVFSKLLTLLF